VKRLSMSVLITRKALADIEKRLAPKIINRKCACCGGAMSTSSPSIMMHAEDCADDIRQYEVMSIIRDGLADARRWRRIQL